MIKKCKSLISSAAIVMPFIAFLTIYSALSKPFNAFLKSITGHHWITKGVISIALFIVLFLLFEFVFKLKEENLSKKLFYLNALTFLSALAIFLFYLWEFLSK